MQVTLTKIKTLFRAKPMATTIAIYIVFFIVACLLFSYLRFPAIVFKPVVVSAAKDLGINMDVSQMDLVFPLGLSMTDVEVIPQKRARRGIHLEKLNIRPALISSIFGNEKYILKAMAYGGTSAAEVGVYGKDLSVSFTFDDLNLGEVELLKKRKWFVLSTALSGSGNLELPKGLLIKGSGDLDAKLNSGIVKLGKIFAPDVQPVIVSSGTARLKMRGGRIEFNRFEEAGPQLSIKVTGSINLTSAPRHSRLALTVAINLDKQLAEQLGPMGMIFSEGKKTFRVGGTLQDPILR